MRIVIRLSWLLLSALLYWFAQSAAAIDTANSKAPEQRAGIEVFVREGCPHCTAAKEFLVGLQHERPELKVILHDVQQDPSALEYLQFVARDRGVSTVRVPAFLVNGQLIVGFSDAASTGRIIRNALTGRTAPSQNTVAPSVAASCTAPEVSTCEAPALLASPESFAVSFLGHELALDRVGLPLFTLILGLLDGFNPCSMWVLILIISLLAPMHNRSRMLAIAGTFIAVEGIAYFVFMAAWLNFFLLIGYSRVSEITVAIIALLAGAIHIKDFWRPDLGISLSISEAAKPGIYVRMRRVLRAENLGAALLGIVILAILVQIVEFMCTSGIPALFTRILTLRQLDVPSYYAYLLLYDLAYMFDDVIILAIGVITLSQRRLQEDEGRWLKLLSGLVMAGLGIYLLLITQ